jgi:TolA-binding protein
MHFRLYFLFLSFTLSGILTGHNAAFAQQSLRFKGPEKYYIDGNDFVLKGKYQAAIYEFQQYLKKGKDPLKLADAEYYIAYSSVQLQHPDAEYKVETFAKNHPFHPKASVAYYELGNFKYASGKYPEAIKYYKKLYFTQLSKKEADEARFKLGYSHFAMQNFDEAYTYFNDLKRKEGEFKYASNYYSGYINFEKGEYDRAFYDFQRAEENEYYANVVPALLIKVYYRQERYDELLEYGEQVLESTKRPSNINDIYLYLGETYFVKGQYKNAVEYLGQYKISTKSGASKPVLYRLAYAHMKLSSRNEAIKNFESVAVLDDTLGQLASFYLGDLYAQNEEYQYAANAYSRASKYNFNRAIQEEATFQSASMNYALGNNKSAIETLKQFQSDYPNAARQNEALELLTEAFFSASNYDAAMEYFEQNNIRSEKVKSAYQKAAFFKAVELFNAEKFAEAVSVFDKSLQYPMNENLVIRAQYWKGEAYCIGKKYDMAIGAYGNVFNNDPGGKTPYYLMSRYGIGYAYFNQQKYVDALRHFKQYTSALENADDKMNYTDALLRLGDCYYATKNYDEALATFDRVINIDPYTRDYAYYRKGIIYGINGQLEPANKSLDQVLSKYPQSTHYDAALYHKAQFNFEAGQNKTAIPVFTRLINQWPQSRYVPYALQSRAVASTNIDDHTQAYNDYKALMERYPNHELAQNALLGIQEALNKLGRSSEFQQIMSRYKSLNPENTSLESVEYEAIRKMYFNQDYNNLIGAVNIFINNYPESSYLTEVKYYKADAQYRSDQLAEALYTFYEIEKDQSFTFYNRVIQRIADLEYKNANYPKAIDYYHVLEGISSSKRSKYNAWSGLMKSFYYLPDYDSVIHYSKVIRDRAQVSSGAENEALLLAGKAAMAKGSVDQAYDFFINTVNNAKDVYAAEAQYRMAEISHNNQQFEQSNETLFNLNTQFSMYDYWIGQSFLLIAQNYEKMGNTFQAKATLQSIIDNAGDSALVKKARGQLEALEAEIPKDEQSADTLEIDNPESQN